MTSNTGDLSIGGISKEGQIFKEGGNIISGGEGFSILSTTGISKGQEIAIGSDEIYKEESKVQKQGEFAVGDGANISKEAETSKKAEFSVNTSVYVCGCECV